MNDMNNDTSMDYDALDTGGIVCGSLDTTSESADQMSLDLRDETEVTKDELRFQVTRILGLYQTVYGKSRQETVRNAQEAYGMIAEKSVAVTALNKLMGKELNNVLLSLGNPDEAKPVEAIASLGNTVNDLIFAAIDMLSVTQYADRCLMDGILMAETSTQTEDEDEDAAEGGWSAAESHGEVTESGSEDVRAILHFPDGATSSDPDSTEEE